MHLSSRLLAGVTAAAALAVVSTPGAAFAAPAKKTPVLTVKVSSSSVVVGHQVTVTPALHLPAKDKLKSFTLTYADGSKATGTKLPKNWKHVYKKALSGKVTLSVKDTLKHTYSATAAIKVTAPIISVAPPLITIPTAPAYVAPAGIFSGHVSSQGVALGGITVSVVDHYSGTVYNVTTTDSHGNWAFASLPASATGYGDDINVNSINGFDNVSTAYNVGGDFELNPSVTTVFNLDLPPLAAVTGLVTSPDATFPTDAAVVACAEGCTLFQYVQVASNGTYSIPLGTGLTWTVDAAADDGNEISNVVQVSVPSGSTTVSGPTLTLASASAQATVAHGAVVARAELAAKR